MNGSKKISAKLWLVITIVMVALFSFLMWGFATDWGYVRSTRITIVGDDGLRYSGLMFVPENATDDNPAPAMIPLHGGSSQARDVEDWGIEGDAHAGKWHRQVSLLSHEKVEAFRARGAVVDDGAFGENLVVEGYDFKTLPIGTKFRCGDVELELTQVGKECHSHCEIYKVMGDCIMPREGVFTRVLHGGTISVGDELTMVEEG